jgi:hypothetical protein
MMPRAARTAREHENREARRAASVVPVAPLRWSSPLRIPAHSPRAFARATIGAGSLLIATVAGCSTPSWRAHAELPARRAAIRTVGVLPSLLTVYQEQAEFEYGFTVNRLVRHDDWTRAAAAALEKAFRDDSAAVGWTVATLGVEAGERTEPDELADLFSVVDLSITRHVYGDFDENFPDHARTFDYSLGPAQEWMERQHVDAVWIVTGFVLLPTAGAQVNDAVQVLMAIVAAAGRAPGVTAILPKLDVRAALVAADGTILLYTRIGESDVTGGPPAADATDPAAWGTLFDLCVRTLIAQYEAAGSK